MRKVDRPTVSEDNMLYIAADHAGFELKEYLKKEFSRRSVRCTDFGAYTHDTTDDYPDFIIPLASAVGKKPAANRGIVLGWSGQGEALAANKIKGVRAALYYGGPTNILKLSRTHNNTNVLSLGAGFLTKKEVLKAVLLWLKTPFSHITRHTRRIKKITSYEKNSH